jgi:hypothetical protein
MLLKSVTLSAAGDSAWIPTNPWLVHPGSVGLGLTFSSNANLTASAQYTYDDPMQNARPVTYARAGTVLTITDNGHNLNVSDSVVVSSDSNSNFNGERDVASIVDQNNYTVTVPNSGATNGSAYLQSFRVFKHPTLGNQSGTPPTRIDGGLSYQVGAIRLQVSAYTAGSATLTAQQGKGG